FMSPEQAAGRVDQIDHRSDQWALAVLSWHMLSGRLPIWKPDVNGILNQVIPEDPTPLAPEFAGLIPREVDKVLRRVFSKKREDRFPTINAFARAFEAAAAGAPVRPTAPAEGRRSPALAPARGGSAVRFSLGILVVLAAAAGWMFRVEITSSKWWPDALPRAGGAESSAAAKAGPDDGDRRHRRPPRHCPRGSAAPAAGQRLIDRQPRGRTAVGRGQRQRVGRDDAGGDGQPPPRAEQAADVGVVEEG